jgi:serine/threonine protein kinase/Tfp pilus assembly protein PilF
MTNVSVMDMLSQLRSAVADRYTVEKELGRGGTAVVFLAHDKKHDRLVAMKVLQPELGIARERFLREIKVAARLRHAHILPLHDSGEADGLLYYVMPYIEGETLAARLRRDTQLPAREAVLIGSEVADALDYAHKRGVVHRDIKPGNILLENGHATVADFGIAHALGSNGDEDLTTSGKSIGTPAYMSPEQFDDSEPVDGRSDIYSLACVVYEMVTGIRPFKATTTLASIAKRLTADHADLTAVAAAGAPQLTTVLKKALATDPADRFATAGEFRSALTSAFSTRRGTPARGVRKARSIAVLPFANMSNDREAEYFADGVSEELINALTKLGSLRVASRTSSFAFKGKELDVRRIGHQLNVETVLEGSVRKAGNRLRVTAQLVNVANGYHLWSERFDRELTDVFAIQDEIANAIVDTLKIKLIGAEKGPLVKPRTENLRAYELYLKGRHFIARRGEGLVRALTYFNESITADPKFASAHAALADTYNLLGWWCVFPANEAFPRAKEAATRALALVPELAEAHSALGFEATFYDWDAAAAERHLLRAIELNPGYATVHHWYAEYLMCAGQFEEAVAQAEGAQELDPVGLIVNTLVGMANYFARRPDVTIAECRETLDMEPAFVPALFWMGYAYLQKGEYQKALEKFDALSRFTAAHRLVPGLTAFAHARIGNMAAAESDLATLSDADLPDVHAVSSAMALLGRGDLNGAIDSLERACEHRACWLAFLGVDPLWDELRSDERFKAILKRVGFPRA